MNTQSIRVSKGFSDAERGVVAHLFWQAFQRKLNFAMRPDDKALQFLTYVVDPAFALAARDETGVLMGVAGFKTSSGALVGGGMRDLARVYGWPGALWRGVLLSTFDRAVEPGVLLMDGIFVPEHARGRGIGGKLLDAIKDLARAEGLHSVRLDVIDTNPRARALYERKGFRPGATTHLGPLRHVFGFSSSVEMRAKISA